MATYSEWPLPLNPPNPYGVYLHSLAPIGPRDRYVYYTKYILGIIGELDVAGTKSARVREWTFPPQLYTSTMMAGRPVGLEYLERGTERNTLWCLLEEYHGALIKFQPGSSGQFTRYTTKGPATPLVYPKALKFDGDGGLWFTGNTRTNPVSTISHFDPATKTATSWEVPAAAMRNLASIHPDRAGRKVWVSAVDTNLPSATHWIGCLDVASGVLTCFSPDPYNDPPRSIDIVLVEGAKGDSVWFTAATSLQVTVPSRVVPAIYRLDLASNAFHRHVTDRRTSWPRFVAVDPGGVAWVSDIGRGSIVSCNPRRDCGTVRFRSRDFQLRRSSVRLSVKDYGAETVVSSSARQDDQPSVARFSCAEEYRAPAMYRPDRVQLQLPGAAPNARLFFVNFGANKIGMLEP